jgi:hypothetical protein
MEVEAIAGMLFTLILCAMIGGFVLLLPISRRIGRVLEQRLEDKSLRGESATRLNQLEATVRSLREELDRVTERQNFTESLLEERRPQLLEGDSKIP